MLSCFQMIRNHKGILKSSNVKVDGINSKGFGIFSKFPIIPQFFPHIPIRLQVSVKCVILLFEMKKIPRILIRDYILLGLGLFLFFTLFRPWGMRNSATDTLWALQSIGCCLMISVWAIVSEIVVTYVFRLPCDYSRDWSYQIRRKAIFYPLLIAILAAWIGPYFTVIEHGLDHWYYFWTDSEGNFSLGKYLDNAVQDAVWCIFVGLYWYFVTETRMRENKIQELLSLNEQIETAGDVDGGKTEAVTIAGESKESLTVSPSDILYIESVANYLSIWYFKDGDLKQKRIRNTLKNVEEILSGYPFLLHCHRAFLVNTRFITHVDGNAAGCQIHLFSVEHTIPVSKANVGALRHALSNK